MKRELCSQQGHYIERRDISYCQIKIFPRERVAALITRARTRALEGEEEKPKTYELCLSLIMVSQIYI